MPIIPAMPGAASGRARMDPRVMDALRRQLMQQQLQGQSLPATPKDVSGAVGGALGAFGGVPGALGGLARALPGTPGAFSQPQWGQARGALGGGLGTGLPSWVGGSRPLTAGIPGAAPLEPPSSPGPAVSAVPRGPLPRTSVLDPGAPPDLWHTLTGGLGGAAGAMRTRRGVPPLQSY
jgi:hypothetical protein